VRRYAWIGMAWLPELGTAARQLAGWRGRVRLVPHIRSVAEARLELARRTRYMADE
jgi:hypothetical protein